MSKSISFRLRFALLNERDPLKHKRDVIIIVVVVIIIIIITIFQLFAANSDRDTIVSQVLTPRFRARYVRFVAMTWHNHISMRAELYGCPSP